MTKTTMTLLLIPCTAFSGEKTIIRQEGMLSGLCFKRFRQGRQLFCAGLLYSIDTLQYAQLSDKELVVYYETDGQNRLTHGRTINMERYVLSSDTFVRQSKFKVSRFYNGLVKHTFTLQDKALLVLSPDGTELRSFLLTDYPNLEDLAAAIVKEAK